MSAVKMLRLVSDWFWSAHVWLPPGYTWQHFQTSQLTNNGTDWVDPDQFAQFHHLLYPLPLSLALILLRMVITRTVFKPLASNLGLQCRNKPCHSENSILESVYRKAGGTASLKQDLNQLSEKSGLSEIQIERWFRQRRLSDLPDTSSKFCETGWRCMFYSWLLLYGAWCLWDKPWLWDIRHCWYDYPNHPMPSDIWCYYMMEMAFYWSLSISQFFDVKRKDFWEMMIHHNATILLMMFSWTGHFTRIGTLVMILHDAADPLLELAKLFRYANYRKTCDTIFAIFSVVWIITRCGIYPAHILYSTLYEAAFYIDFFSAYYIFNGLLVILQVLHFIWTYFLIRAVHKAVVSGGIDDKRSDSEEYTSEDENYNQVKKEE